VYFAKRKELSGPLDPDAFGDSRHLVKTGGHPTKDSPKGSGSWLILQIAVRQFGWKCVQAFFTRKYPTVREAITAEKAEQTQRTRMLEVQLDQVAAGGDDRTAA
jgi:hypothetical protein